MTGSAECDLAPFEAGEILSEKYVLLRRIGAGGMGVVFEGENTAIGRRVAIKVPYAVFAAQPEYVARFEREAREVVRIGHPNIVEMIDLGRSSSGLPYIVMERLEGEELSTVMIREGPLPVARAVAILSQVLDALSATHALGVVHRDIKPENIFLTRHQGRPDFVKVMDFGIAGLSAHAEGERLTRAGRVFGTPGYMSPEQARGTSTVDARSDLYSAGVILYEALSGRVPHPGANTNAIMLSIATETPPPLHAVAPDVPRPLADVVDRAMARDLDSRFQTALEFHAALDLASDPLRTDDVASTEVRPRATLAAPAATETTDAPPPVVLRPSRRKAAVALVCFGLIAFGPAAYLALERPADATAVNERSFRAEGGALPERKKGAASGRQWTRLTAAPYARTGVTSPLAPRVSSRQAAGQFLDKVEERRQRLLFTTNPY